MLTLSEHLNKWFIAAILISNIIEKYTIAAQNPFKGSPRAIFYIFVIYKYYGLIFFPSKNVHMQFVCNIKSVT